MSEDIYMNLKEAYEEADMILAGLGSKVGKKSYKDDKNRIDTVNFYAGVLEKKNYFILTSHRENIFKDTCVNTRRICNPLIQDDESEKQWDLYNKWLSASLNKKLLIIEIGEDFNNPNLFRWPFEKVVYINQKSRMFRINSTFYQLPADIGERAVSVNTDEMTFLSDLRDYIV